MPKHAPGTKVLIEVKPSVDFDGERTGAWYWRQTNIRNGETLVHSETYVKKGNAIRAAKRQMALMLPGVAELWVEPT